MSQENMGSSIDDFLREEGTFEEVQAQAVKEVVAWQLGEAMKTRKISKSKMAALLKTSRSQVDRLLDPQNDITLGSLQRAAACSRTPREHRVGVGNCAPSAVQTTAVCARRRRRDAVRDRPALSFLPEEPVPDPRGQVALLAGAGRYPPFLRIIAFIDEGVGCGAVPNAVHGGQLDVAADFSESVKDLLAERVRHGRIVGPMEGPDRNVLEFRRIFPRRQPAGAWNGCGETVLDPSRSHSSCQSLPWNGPNT